MTAHIRLAALVAMISVNLACFDYHGPVLERRTDRSFTVAPGSLVNVAISGGPITVETGPAGQVRIQLLEEVHAQSDRDADDILKDVEVTLEQRRDEVQLTAKRHRIDDWRFWSGSVRFSAVITAPADVRLNLNTSGGRIRVNGERTAAVTADTSGGSITVDGGDAPLTLDTSGGSIRVGAALDALDADTSGGSITIDYVGPDAKAVTLDTSGGSIRVGVDPDAKLDVNASTSGGGVDVDALPMDREVRERSHVAGSLNGGGAPLRATTSGGGIHIKAARPPRPGELPSEQQYD
jgi:type V secretory pathway adhesin AidA